ncbi:MAG TPA: hypothetical protein VFY18_12985 [Candidatus Limnocylindrales bacterium]|nr:hypothetical protein [Candidatus Limnocylindrales bacterium]
MTRRLSLSLLAIVASLSVVVGACASTPPAAPALTDPKEILTTSVTSIKDIKTFEVTGTFNGMLKVPQMGDFDLSTVKLSAAIDIAAKKLKFGLDAPSLLGTKIDALVIDNVTYYKVAGMLGTMLGAGADKYTKTELPTSSGNPAADATDVVKLVADLRAALDKLPTPPTKAADEKCGDQDCYHVTMKATAAQLQALDPSVGTVGGDASFDLWSRKNDNRPAKISFAMTTTEMGTFGLTLDFKYDIPVTVDAPPADQIVTP